MAIYAYTPIYIDTGDNNRTEPGKGDPVVSALPDIPPSTKAIKYDEGVRFVLEMPDGSPVHADWTQKTKAEVNADYPGLVP